MFSDKRCSSLIIILSIFVISVLPSVTGYEIDGDLLDWDLDLEADDWSQNSTWIPSSVDSKRFVVEDNSDPQYFDSEGNLLPAFNHFGKLYPGIHLMATPAASIVPYEESQIRLYGDGKWVVPPSGGEGYDIEALYLDKDLEYLYVAIVASIGPDENFPGSPEIPKIGDLDISINSPHEYGIKLTSIGGIDQFILCSDPTWADAIHYPLEAPYGGTPSYMETCNNPIANLSDLGLIKIKKMGKIDKGRPNWIYELAIPLESIGSPNYIYLNQVVISEACGNDFTDVPTPMSSDADGDGYIDVGDVGDDCNDNDASVNPGATEITCDGIDNDCDPNTLDAPDADGDGYDICDPGDAGDTDSNDADCDDGVFAVNPGATEICGDGIDNNCDGIIESCDPVDKDGDGYIDVGDGGDDCNDNDASVNPGATEITCDGIDNDCDPNTLDAPDADGDGYDICDPGDAGDTDSNDADCDDGNSAINPGVPEICGDGIDNNCDGIIESCDPVDKDGDGYIDVGDGGDDCNDNDASVNPGATEITCDGIDNDCDPNTLDAPDADGDGYDICDPGDAGDTDSNDADCDDGVFAVNPGATEICADNIDNDCDGIIESCAPVDSTPPNIIINSPINITYIQNFVTLSVTVSDLNGIDWIAYSLNGVAPISILFSTLINGLSDGQHNITVFANDSYGNMGSETVYFSVDTHPPIVDLISPANGTMYTSNNIPLIFTVSDYSDIEWTGYELVYRCDSREITSGNTTLMNLQNGWYRITVRANDTFDHMGSDNGEFSVAFTSFPDVPPHYWAYDDITYLVSRGIVNGYQDGYFRPTKSISRAESSKIITLAMDLCPIYPETPTFTDVPKTHWAYGYVEAGVQAGIISGYADGTFKPANKVSRAQIAKMIATAEGWTYSGGLVDFPDVPPNFWAYDYIMAMKEMGVISGFPDDGYFYPSIYATRAETSKMTTNMMKAH